MEIINVFLKVVCQQRTLMGHFRSFLNLKSAQIVGPSIRHLFTYSAQGRCLEYYLKNKWVWEKRINILSLYMKIRNFRDYYQLMVNKISAFFCRDYNTILECRSLRKIKVKVIESHLKKNKWV